MKSMLIVGVLFFLATAQIFEPPFAQAELEWMIEKDISLESTPLDVSTSENEQVIFILVPGEVLVYSVADDQMTERIPVEKSFDRLTYSAKENSLILSSSWERLVRIISLENVYDISISHLPFKGAVNAPVTIAVFSEYQ